MPSDFNSSKFIVGLILSRAQKKEWQRMTEKGKEGISDGTRHQAAGKSLWGDRKKLGRQEEASLELQYRGTGSESREGGRGQLMWTGQPMSPLK